MNIGQPEIPACVPEGQLFVIKSEQMKHCCMQIMHADRVLHCFKTDIIRGAVY